MAAEYALTADALLNFGRDPPSGERAFVRWASFADRVGPSVLPFVIRPDRLDDVPFKALGLTPVRLSDMVPQPDEMWVLFCFRDSFRDAVPPDSPLRADGFPLVLEWRRGQGDSELLSGAFHELADRVRGQFGEGGKEWGLHPAFDRYGDAVAFTDPDLFSDSENSLQIASAWGALAVGLHRRLTGKYHGGWPFPSIQWEWGHKKAAGVAGIAKKLSVAADCGATVVTVAGEQKREAQDLLARLKRSDADGRYGRLSILAARDVADPRALARGICDDAVRRGRLRRLMIAAGVFLCALVAAVGAFFYDSSRTVSFHYADYVDSFGLPEGIFPLKESELAHRHVHYRFEYRGFQRGKSPHADSAGWCIWNMLGFRRRLVRVVQANSHGYPRKWEHTEYADRPQIQDFKYDRNLRLREICYGRYNGEGREPYLEKRVELWNEGGVTNGLVKFFVNKGQLGFAYGATQATTFNPVMDPMSGKSEITQHLVQRDANGRVTQRLFLNLSGGNVPDGDGLYGFSCEYDDLGRQTAQWYLFREGDGFSRRANKKGVAGRKYEYAGRNMRKSAYVDPEGRPVTGLHGWMVCIDEFDEFDNNTRSTFCDEKGNVTLCASGIAGYTAVYDSSGNLTNISFFGIDGKPTLHKDGYAELRQEYDVRGNMTKVSYFGVDGRPTLHKDGIAGLRAEYDERGNVTKQLCFGVDGMPVLSKDGYAEKRAEYDERGNVTKVSYFDVDGKPTLHRDGNAGWVAEYDARGNETKCSFFDIDGKPALLKFGYAEYRKEYDARGNATKILFFGVDGKLVMQNDGVAEWRREYDSCGNIVKSFFFGIDGKPTLHKNGFASWVSEYDARGNKTKTSLFDVDGRPALHTDGYTEVRMEYDDHGNTTRISFLGIDGESVVQKDGVAEWRREYDGCGNEVKSLYFDVDGKPTLHREGFAGWVAEYDAYGRRTRKVWIGLDGKPTLSRSGYAEERTEYDEHGRKTRTVRIGVDGKPMLAFDGYAEDRTEYDARGNETKISFFGADGKPILIKGGYAGGYMEYDRYGNCTRIAFFDTDGKPVLNTDCYAELRKEYDGRGNPTRYSYFGIDGKLALSKDGYAECRNEYDDHGHVTKVLYFGIDGKPTLHKDGNAGWAAEYDARGNETKRLYLGVDGRPTLLRDGFAGWVAEYDACGNETRKVWIGVDGNPIRLKEGFAEVRREYDACGNKIKESCFGVDGAPTLHNDGFFEVRFTYKENGTIDAARYFDVSGNAVTLRRVVVSVDVAPNLPAAKLGVQKGDVWCRLDTYEVVRMEKGGDVIKALQACQNTEKELIVARKKGESYEILSFKLPVGLMGIAINDVAIHDYDKLERAYRAYCEKEKRAK